MPRRRLSTEAADAFVLASNLVREGVDESEAAVRLSAVPGGRRTLQETARYVGAYVGTGYPAARMHRLLWAAVGEPVQAPTAEEAAVENRQRQLSEQPPSVAFQQLAEQVPGLRDLEQRARTDPKSFLRELSLLEHLLGGLGAPAQQFRITLGMQKAVQGIVGPSAGLTDPVLSSRAALLAVNKYLREAAEIDGSWGQPGSR